MGIWEGDLRWGSAISKGIWKQGKWGSEMGIRNLKGDPKTGWMGIWDGDPQSQRGSENRVNGDLRWGSAISMGIWQLKIYELNRFWDSWRRQTVDISGSWIWAPCVTMRARISLKFCSVLLWHVCFGFIKKFFMSPFAMPVWGSIIYKNSCNSCKNMHASSNYYFEKTALTIFLKFSKKWVRT